MVATTRFVGAAGSADRLSISSGWRRLCVFGYALDPERYAPVREIHDIENRFVIDNDTRLPAFGTLRWNGCITVKTLKWSAVPGGTAFTGPTVL